MLSQISWTNYFLGCIVTGLVYYTTVLSMYYRKELNRFLYGSKRREEPSIRTTGLPDENVAGQYRIAEELQNETRELFHSLPETLPPEQVLKICREQSAKSGSIADKGLRHAINNLIIKEVFSKFHLSITPEDLTDLPEQGSHSING